MLNHKEMEEEKNITLKSSQVNSSEYGFLIYR